MEPTAQLLFDEIRERLRALPPEEQDQFRRLVLDESTWESETAFAMLGFGLQAISLQERAEAERAKNSRRSRQPENQERDAQIRQDEANGMTQGQIALKHGMDKEAVRSALRRSRRTSQDVVQSHRNPTDRSG